MITLLIFLLHCLATFALTGLIWFVQVVHYPLLRLVPENAFTAYVRENIRRTAWIAGSAMLLEMGTGIALLTIATWRESVFSLTMLLLLGIWLSTFFLQVPLHRRLLLGKDLEAIKRLTFTNWIRTSAWTGRSIILILLSLA